MARTDYIDADGITRDKYGRMVCTHEHPTGSARCPQCRAIILTLHSGTHSRTPTDRAKRPMPDWFRNYWHDLLDTTPDPAPEQPRLEIDQ